MQGYLFGRPVDPEQFQRDWADGTESEIKLA